MNCEKADRASSFPITRPLRQVLPSPEKKRAKVRCARILIKSPQIQSLVKPAGKKQRACCRKRRSSWRWKRASLACGDLDILFAGDLLNQCISSSFAARDTNLPFLGLYGACSTMAESLLLAASFRKRRLCKKSCRADVFTLCLRRAAIPLSSGLRRAAHADRAVDRDGKRLLHCLNWRQRTVH